MLFKESGNVEIVCPFAYAAPEWKFIYLISNAFVLLNVRLR
jgi:hypothetical protein